MYLKSKKTCSIILYNLSSFNIDKYIISYKISALHVFRKF